MKRTERLPHVSRGPYLPPQDEPRESLATLLVGGAVIALWFVFLFLLLPVLT